MSLKPCEGALELSPAPLPAACCKPPDGMAPAAGNAPVAAESFAGGVPPSSPRDAVPVRYASQACRSALPCALKYSYNQRHALPQLETIHRQSGDFHSTKATQGIKKQPGLAWEAPQL